jgi:hypothetical protein
MIEIKKLMGWPLVIMVILHQLAAAIQDYKRGIIGSKQTYGKGTVQNVIDLNQFVEVVIWVIWVH